MDLDELRTEVLGIVIKARFRRWHGIERLPQVLTEFLLIEVPRNGIEWIEVIELVPVLVLDTPLRKHFGHEAMDGHAAHGADMHAAGEGLLIADKELLPARKRILNLFSDAVCPEH